MSDSSLRLVVLGLSITSSWGNGHATTFRSLLREWSALGHTALFLERDVPWYAPHRDLPRPPFCEAELYRDFDDLRARFESAVRDADAVLVGSYVPEGVRIGEWVNATAEGVSAFYDIDTPVTLAKLARGDFEYLSPDLIPRYQAYFSFTGGETLEILSGRYGSPAALPLYCSADPGLYYPEARDAAWQMGYLGTFSPDRQPALEELMIEPALHLRGERFVVAGPQYPPDVRWPANVHRIDHVAPEAHRDFYNRQRFTLNLTRADMRRAGFSPSVRLFEAAACGVPIISDMWPGIETFFEPGREILLASSTEDVLEILRDIDEDERREIGARARKRVLSEHSSRHRAQELATHLNGIRQGAALPL